MKGPESKGRPRWMDGGEGVGVVQRVGGGRRGGEANEPWMFKSGPSREGEQRESREQRAAELV